MEIFLNQFGLPRNMRNIKTHPTAEVSKEASIGAGTVIWNNSQVREKAIIGKNCILAKNVYIDTGVVIGNCVKIQNNSSIYKGAVIEDGVFIGPHACLTNDKTPRATTKDGKLKKSSDWKISSIRVKKCASIGAGSILIAGVIIGEYALVGAGSVVTKNVPDYGLVYGNPARLVGFVDKMGKRKAK